MVEIVLGGERVPAEWADSWLEQTRGFMFHRETPDYALVFPGGDVQTWSLHMLFVPFPLEAVFVVDGVVEEVVEMAPWTGTASAEAECVIEIPNGLVDVEPGMEVG